MSVGKRIGDIGLYYDPLYGHIPIRPLMRKALNLRTMQRLRRLKQLATLDLAFPGATHTRFAHSVGVFHIASLMFDSLFDTYSGFRGSERNIDWPTLTPHHKLAVQLAALFHDVGHGPFSHIFELFCKRHTAYKKMEHEYISEELITKGIGEYNDIPGFLHSIIDAEKKKGTVEAYLNFFEPNNIAKMVQGISPPADPKYLFLSQIVKWPLDADRMDYLRRDSLYTGVETGRVDIWEIINNLMLCREKLPDGKEVYTLKVNRSAAIAVEAFLQARDFTYRRLYFNETHRANQELIVRGLRELAERFKSPRELTLRTDDQILLDFQNGSPFTKKIAKRLTMRTAYEALPFKIGVYEDLPPSAKRQWEDLLKLDRAIIFETEKKLAREIGIPFEDILIFDIEKSPLAKKEDFQERIIYDANSQNAMSLIEALPHLALTRGEFNLPFYKEPIDLSAVYLNMLSHIFIFLPDNFISDRINEYRDACTKNGVLPNAETISRVFENQFQSSCFAKIFAALTNLLKIEGKAKDKLLLGYKESLKTFVTHKVLETEN